LSSAVLNQAALGFGLFFGFPALLLAFCRIALAPSGALWGMDTLFSGHIGNTGNTGNSALRVS